MSRVFDFVERWVAETEQKRDSGVGERKSQKPEEGSAGAHFETGLWPTQRGSALPIWTGSIANARPLKPPLSGKEITLFSLKESILLYDLTST